MRTKREQIIFQAFHDQICRSEFSSGLTLFFGLHGNSSIRYQSAEYSMPAGALLVVNPFELYQVNCSENAEMIAMQIPENLLQLANWSRQNVCFCYASRMKSRSTRPSAYYLQRFFRISFRIRSRTPPVLSPMYSSSLIC